MFYSVELLCRKGKFAVIWYVLSFFFARQSFLSPCMAGPRRDARNSVTR